MKPPDCTAPGAGNARCATCSNMLTQLLHMTAAACAATRQHFSFKHVQSSTPPAGTAHPLWLQHSCEPEQPSRPDNHAPEAKQVTACCSTAVAWARDRAAHTPPTTTAGSQQNCRSHIIILTATTRPLLSSACSSKLPPAQRQEAAHMCCQAMHAGLSGHNASTGLPCDAAGQTACQQISFEAVTLH